MPWRECCKMDERLRFVARLYEQQICAAQETCKLEGEKMAVLCREFDISRKTGYKIFSRYKDCGMQGLTDRSRRPYRHANRLPFQMASRSRHRVKSSVVAEVFMLRPGKDHTARRASNRRSFGKSSLLWKGCVELT
jgi:hypothetical protein